MNKKPSTPSAFLNPRVALVIFLCLTGVFHALGGAGSQGTTAPLPDTPFTFANTGSLHIARSDHSTTLLSNGMALAAGGADTASSLTASAELYNPANGTWTATGSLNTARGYHRATLLPNGMVLVAGGFDNSFGATASAELYDPASGAWTATGGLNTARYYHTATLLPNGKVLVAGGLTNAGVTGTAELYDPVSGTWTATGNLNFTRRLHTATLLPNGMVLVAGGADGNAAALASAELYNPANGTWTASGNLNTARFFHTATLLPSGMVLVAGGEDQINNKVFANAELYNPANGTWTASGNLNTARFFHTAALLPTGLVLVAGGTANISDAFASAELYDPANGTWAFTGSLNTAREFHTAILLSNGMVLEAGGGTNSSNKLSSAELYDSGATPTPTPTPTPSPSPTPIPGTVLANISTRLIVETGDNALIGGFIVTGTQSKKVIVRAIGPSLASGGVPVPGRLLNPTLDLNGPGGLIATNDNWRGTQEAEIIATGVPPPNELESAIVATLPANSTGYTAVMRGINNTTGIGLIEVYDLDRTVDSKLANISTRGLVQMGDNVMIGGVIALGAGSQRVIVRAIGPSLPLTGTLADPTLELHNSDGTLLSMNDNWRDTQETEIIATGVPPTNNLESAIVATLPASSTGIGYTAIVRGVNGTTGIALVEFYALAP